MSQKITPSNIAKLKKNEVFVFGSNMNGNHLGGAAKLAQDKFGAIHGQAFGLQGKSFAIPSLDYDMSKLSLSDFGTYVSKFIAFAEVNPDKLFLVTDIGCGIAGFTHAEIAPFFKGAVGVANVSLPQAFIDHAPETVVVPGYKGFESDLKCRDFKYELGKEFETEGAKCCNYGFHYCTNPFDVWSYYPPTNGNRFTEVQGSGQIDTETKDSKVASSKLKIGLELNLKSFIQGGVKFIFEKTTSSENTLATTGNYANAATTGYRANAATTGESANAATTGESANAATTGESANAATTGESANAATTGYRANAATTGNYANAATTGESANAATTGNYANAATTGYRANAATTGESANAATTGYRANAATTGESANAATTGNYANAATTGESANAATTGESANAATTGNYANAATTGYRANAATTGYRANAATTGNYANAATTGYRANAATTGYRANAATTGNYANAATTGESANAATTGNYANAATTGESANAATTGESANAAVEGSNAIAAALGINSNAKGALGCWIVVSEWEQQPDWSWKIKEVKSVIVDGEIVKADTYYKLKNGELVQA